VFSLVVITVLLYHACVVSSVHIGFLRCDLLAA